MSAVAGAEMTPGASPVASRKAFLQQVEESLDFGPADQEDLPSMSFYAWLKSKMVQRKYYDVLLELAEG